MNEVITQEKIVSALADSIFDEILLWSQSKWWPERCLMQFINLSEDIGVNTVYLQKIKIPLNISWHTRNEIVDKNKRRIKRVFIDGMFDGFEEISVIQVENRKCRLKYSFNYKVNGFINKLMWKLLFKMLHTKNINLVLNSIKCYLERERISMA